MNNISVPFLPFKSDKLKKLLSTPFEREKLGALDPKEIIFDSVAAILFTIGF